MVLRPDEEAALATREREERFDKNLKSGIKTAAALGVGGLTAGIGSKIAPFLNQYIPLDLAVKGISKVAPQIGQFLKRGEKMGLDIGEGLDFIKKKFDEDSDKKNPKENRNIVQQYSPELHQFISEQIQNGQNPAAAAFLAQKDSKNNKFKEAIDKIQKDHKMDFISLVESIYGNESKAALHSNQPQPSQPQQQSGQGQQALMQILQKINQRFGG